MSPPQTASPSLEAGSLFNVSGLVALVTGGGTGIGLMMAQALARNGAAKVYIAGRRLDVLQAAAATAPALEPLVLDVTSKESLRAAAARIESEVGYLNLLVCNSGIGGPQVKPVTAATTLEDWADDNFGMDYEAYLSTFSVNTTAVWFTVTAFAKLLGKGNEKGNVTQSSQVIVTSSIAGFNKKNTGGWAYGQSKAAVTLAVKQLAVALPQWNIR